MRHGSSGHRPERRDRRLRQVFVQHLKAMKAFKDANDHYRRRTGGRPPSVTRTSSRLSRNFEPSRTSLAAYFFLGEQLRQSVQAGPGRGRRTTTPTCQKAIENYTMAAERAKIPDQAALAANTWSPPTAADKLNDPAQAEPIVQQMIETRSERADQLFRPRPRSTRTPAATKTPRRPLLKARDAKPNDPAVYTRHRRASTTARVNSTRRWRPSRRPPTSSRTTRRATI